MASTNRTTQTLSTLTNQIGNPTLEAFGHAISGATAGAFALCILYPLDQIKVRTAVESESRILTSKIIIDDFIHLRMDNIMDIYRGLSFGVLEQFSFNGVYFFFYQLLKSDWQRKYASNSQKEMPWLTSLIRGSIAGLITQLFTTPLKVIQIRKQTAATHKQSQMRHILSNVYNNHGMTGFWSGMKASVILVINPAIVQLVYGRVRNYLNQKFGFINGNVYIDLLSGALSKAIATVICYPLVLIKMNLQIGGESDSNGKLKPRQRRSMTDIFDSKIKQKGIFGLYSGLGPKLIHASLTNAITFASKEKFCVYVFAVMVYLQRVKSKGKSVQKMAV